MGRLKNSPRGGVALSFLHITVIIVVAGSVVLAVDSPQGSNPRRLLDLPESKNSTSKGQGHGDGDRAPNVPNNKTDVNANNATDSTIPSKNINSTNTTAEPNGKSLDKGKIPQGSENHTISVPGNGQDSKNESMAKVNDQHLGKDPSHNDTLPSPSDESAASNKTEGNPGADPEKEKPLPKDKEKNNGKNLYPPGCEESHSCSDKKKKMIACLRAPGNDMLGLSLLIQNKGEDSMQVHIEAPDFLKVDTNLTLGKEESKTVPVLIVGQASRNLNQSKIVISGDNGECLLDVPNQLLNIPYKQRFFEGFSYSSIITPMFGVYLLLFTVLAIGGSWMCCKLRGKRKHGDGIRYQELEMNLPESTLPITAGGKPEAENMDGWDEVWDDSWEDAEAARSSSRPMQSLSSKGLAARKSNKDGWDNSWDD